MLTPTQTQRRPTAGGFECWQAESQQCESVERAIVCVCLCVFLFDLLKKDMGQHLCPGVRNGETFYTLCSPISSLYVLGCFFSGTMTRGR